MTRQSGVTLLIVLVIVALSTLIAAQLIEHGTYAERRTKLTLAREQAYQLAMGGEALAKKWLAKGFGKDAKVHLQQPWATTPFEYPVEGGFIKATVMDAQSCFNLNSLDPNVQESDPGGGSRGSGGPQDENSNRNGRGSNTTGQQDIDQLIYENLVNEALKTIDGVTIQPEALSASLVDWIDEDVEPKMPDGAEDMTYTGYDMPYRAGNGRLADKSELRIIAGYSAKIYKAIKDFVCVLPDPAVNKININTLTDEQAPILYAVIKGQNIGLSEAQSVLSNRPEEGYDSVNDIQQVLGNAQIDPQALQRLDVTSDHFIVNIEVELKGAAFKMKTLLKRANQQPDAPLYVMARYFGDF